MKNKIIKYGECKSILIRRIKQREVVILVQNAFPTISKYIDYPHMVNGQLLRVSSFLEKEIYDSLEYMLSMKKEGRNLFFTDIDKIKEIMTREKISMK